MLIPSSDNTASIAYRLPFFSLQMRKDYAVLNNASQETA